jgi:hypothetical protein
LKVPAIPGVTTTTSGTKTTATTGGKTAVAAAGLTTASKVAATAAASTSNIVTGSFNAGSFRTAEAATTPPTINLTVNGAIDSESTARTIVQTLNDSFYRGTGGASSLQIA